MSENDLSKRLFSFAVQVLRFLRKLPDTIEYRTIRYQLSKSATSSGANYEEAQAGSSKADFHNKVAISLKEMRESNWWLRLIKETSKDFIEDRNLKSLIDESSELKKILGSIAAKTKK